MKRTYQPSRTRSEAPSRLSFTLGDRGRPQGAGRTPREGPQEAVCLRQITARRDFLAANAGKRVPMPGFILLVRRREDGDSAMRIGITVTKKIGGAVVRNRMKRRFRALARDLLPVGGMAGADHVLIGRAGGVERDYSLLETELTKALRKASAAEGGRPQR